MSGAELDAQVAEAGRVAGFAFRHDLMARTPLSLAEAEALIAAGACDGLGADREQRYGRSARRRRLSL